MRSIRALDGTGLNRSYDAWQTAEWPGVRMALPHAWRKQELRLRFGSRRSDAVPEGVGKSGPQSNWTIAQRANYFVQGLAVRWALSCQLDGYHHALSSHRDRSARDDSYKPVRDLKDLRGLVRMDVFDILSSTSEISAFAKAKRLYARLVLEMEFVDTVRGKRPKLLKELRSSQIRRSRQVEEEARLLLSTLSASTDMSQTISSIRVQRLLILLTVVSIILAVVAVFVALDGKSF